VSARFRRTTDGALQAIFTTDERDLLRALPDELGGVYKGGPSDDDAVRARIFPRAYLDPTAEDAEREWRELVHPELLRDRLAALERVVTTLDHASTDRSGMLVADLGPEDVDAWLGVLNDARLALGTRLKVTEDLDYDDVEPDDPRAAGLAVYGWLTYLEGDLIDTLLGELPEEGED
jgi:hypothetical protein